MIAFLLTVAAQCSSPTIPVSAGTPVLDLNAANMNGNGDGNSGWSDAERVTATSGNRWVNAGSIGGYFGQATSDNQPVWFESCPGFDSGGPCVHFTPGEGTFLDSSLAAGSFKAMHGGDLTCYAVVEMDETNPSKLQYIMGTATQATEVGLRILYDDAPATGHDAFTGQIFNGSGTALVSVDVNYAVATQTRKVLRWVYDNGGAGDDGSIVVNGQSKGTAETSGSVSTSDETFTMRIGGRPSGGSPTADYLDAYVGRLICFGSAHSTDVADDVECALRDGWEDGSASQLSTSGCTIPETTGTADTCCPEGETCRIIAIGDSITLGYRYAPASFPYLLQRQLNAKHGAGAYSVANNAVGGTESDGLLATLWPKVRKDHYHILLLLGGAVDMNLGDDGAATYTNLETIAEQASDDGMCVIWLETLPRGATAGWDAAKQTEMDELVGLIAAESYSDVSIVNSYAAMEDGVTPDDLNASFDVGDGVHLNADGLRCMALIAETGL
ncbi:MAG: SGNH/GDSL hydrolase family protein [Candidatus Nanopelagicales bacterium]